jgi:hypothetical protein
MPCYFSDFLMTTPPKLRTLARLAKVSEIGGTRRSS